MKILGTSHKSDIIKIEKKTNVERSGVSNLSMVTFTEMWHAGRGAGADPEVPGPEEEEAGQPDAPD